MLPVFYVFMIGMCAKNALLIRELKQTNEAMTWNTKLYFLIDKNMTVTELLPVTGYCVGDELLGTVNVNLQLSR